MDDAFSLIDTESALQQLCQRLSSKAWFAIDTEFLREKTYYPKLCLIQVASEDEIACIDPLAIQNLSALKALLTNTNVTKVFHSASQDMEALLHTLGQTPSPIFDTQIAAGLLGQGDQIGYAALVEKLLHVQLPKSQTRTDWSRRPLSSEQLHYAADDVRYLREIYPMQQTLLEQQGRLDWAREDAAMLEDPQKYQPQASTVLRRVKGQHTLPLRQRAVIRELALWREQQAASRNLPRKWVLSDNAVLALAQNPPASMAELQTIDHIPSKTASHHGTELLDIINHTLALDNADISRLVPQNKLTPEETEKVKKVQKRLADIAQTANINPSIIASRREIEHLIQLDDDIPLMHGWRKALAGNTIKEMLAQEQP